MALPIDPGYYDFIRRVWPSISEEQFRRSEKRYARLLDRIGREVASIRDNLDIYALCNPEDIFTVVQKLAQLKTVTKNEAIKAIQGTPSSAYTEDCKLKTLYCAIDLWLSIGLGPRLRHSRKFFSWDTSDTLKEKVTSYFDDTVRGIEPPNLVWQELQEGFSAASLCNHYGFSISWTHNLSEHLAINYDQKALTVYEDKIVAYNHVRAGTASLPVPDQLFEEAIDTLNLLFPIHDQPTKKILAKDSVEFYGLGLCGRPRTLRLKDYHYWRGRIAKINQIFQTPPTGLQQLFLDNEGKNLMSTFTFWVAVSAGVIALFGLALAIASLVYSIKQYELGVKQYEVSIVQACGDSYVRARMPKLCSGES